MPKPSEKLAHSLEWLHKLQKKGYIAIPSNKISRTHRERLVANGFLEEVIKGWYIPSRPEELKGGSTTWYTSFWQFCASYLEQRFAKDWCLSPEQSLLIYAGNWSVPRQLLVYSSKGNNKIIQLPHKTSLLDVRYSMPPLSEIQEKNHLRIFSLNAALIKCSTKFFTQHPTDARVVLSMISNASEMLNLLLESGHSTIAGRLAGAFRNINYNRIADDIIKTMQAVGYDVREKDPFIDETPLIVYSSERSPYVNRMKIMWHEMRDQVIHHFPKPPQHTLNIRSYLKQVEEIYVTDAYHSLSIEGYQVNPTLIEKVRSGQWNPDAIENDRNQRNALAARGYWQAFQSVKKSVQKILNGANPGTIADQDHGHWYLELFKPSVAVGILKPADLAGYRNNQVFIKRSKHIPPPSNAVLDLMPAFFELLKNESEASVRIVLGHFFFVYIHPYMDGNGRIGRFLMNVMLASGGYFWTVIPVEQRNQYLAALEDASVNQDIIPFTKFIASLLL